MLAAVRGGLQQAVATAHPCASSSAQSFRAPFAFDENEISIFVACVLADQVNNHINADD
jgi:hypothetical protein